MLCNLIKMNIYLWVVNYILFAHIVIHPWLWCVPAFHCILWDLILRGLIKDRNILTYGEQVIQLFRDEPFILFDFPFGLYVFPFYFGVIERKTANNFKQHPAGFNKLFIALKPLGLWFHYVLLWVLNHLLMIL